MTMRLEIGDLVRRIDNHGWWLMIGDRSAKSLWAECIQPDDQGNYHIGERDMPFDRDSTHDRGLEYVPAEEIPDHVLTRITTLKLTGEDLANNDG
jgi:hypothetical protein